MSLFHRKQDQTGQQDLLSIFDLPAQESQSQSQNEKPALVWHCAWCMPYSEGATSGICPTCEARYFPQQQ